jgi:flagellar P-ring protein precursor FlgI
MKKILVMMCLCALMAPVQAERIKDIASIAGVRANQLIGYGLVVGLDGTGDQTTQSPFTLQAMNSMLNAMGVSLPPGASVQLRNTAAVIVTATLPAFARPGQALDLTVSSLGNAKSLRGGTLLMTPLKGADGQVYAVAQGNVVIVGASASAPGAKVTVNQQSSGRIPNGATVERAVAQTIDEEVLQLELARSDFTLMQRVAEAINKKFGAGTAHPVDARALQVRVPPDAAARVAFLSTLEDLNVQRTQDSPRVIVNSRTGSVVINQGVQLGPCAIAHGSLTIKVTRTPTVSQPPALSGGETAVTTTDRAEIEQAGGQLMRVADSASLDQVVRALNMMGANPQDLIAILQAMKSAGALHADIEVI